MNVIDILLAGSMLGGLYGLIAMGLTLQYGVARIMNLSYGEFLIAPAFLAFFAVTQWGISPLLLLLLVVPLGFAVQWLVYQLLLTPLVRRAQGGPSLEVDSILATFGMLFVVQGIMLVSFGGDYYSYNFLLQTIEIFGSKVAANRLLVLGVALVLGGGLYLLLTRTRAGAVVRAVSVAPQFAHLVGINVRHTAALAFGLGGAMVAASGVMVSMFLPFSASMGTMFAMKALIVVIMGGVGNLMGCLVAGMLLGFAETLVASFIDPGLTLAVNYAVFLLVLLFKPTGLFGRAAR